MAKKDIYQSALDKIKENDKQKKKTSKKGTYTPSQEERSYISDLAEKAIYKVRANETASRPERLNLIAGDINKDIYKPGSSNAMKGYSGALAHEKNKSLESSNFYVLNPDYYGEQTKQYEESELEQQKFIDATQKIAQARYGDPSALDGVLKGSDEYKQYKGLLNLAGYDLASAAIPENDDLLNTYRNYSREQLEQDLLDVYKHGNSKVYKLSEADYMAAKDRLTAFAGEDVEQAFLDEDVNDVMQRVLGKYDSGNEQLRSKFYESQEKAQSVVAYDDWLNYLDKMDRQKEEANKPAQWAQEIYDKYSGLADRPDFYEKSQYKEPTDLIWKDVYNLASGVLNEEEAAAARERLNRDPSNLYTVTGLSELGYEYMTPGQREKARYLYDPQNIQPFLDYLNDLSWDLNRQRQEAMVEEHSAYAEAHPVLSSAESVPQGIANSLAGIVNLGKKVMGFDINEYDPSFDYGLKQNITRSIVGGNIAEATDGVELFGKNVAQMGYNAVMSATDSTVNAFMFGAGASPMMGAGAFNTSYQQKLEDGLSNQDAFIDALVEGGIETGTEYFSIDALMKDSTSPLGYFLRNLITEPTEEMAGFAANKIYDEIKYGMDSQVNTRISELVKQGYSQGDAKAQATREMLADLFETGFTAFLSGGTAAVGGTIQTAAANQTSGKNLQSHGDEAVKSMLDLANTFHFDEDVQSLIDEQSAILNDPNGKGGVLSPAKIGRIFRETMKAVDENAQQTVQNVTARYVAGELQKNGVDDPEMTDAVVRIVSDNGSAKPEDYQRVTASRGAIAVVEGLTGSIDNARNLSQKAARIAEQAAKKNKNKTTEETTEVVPEVVGETDELTEEEMAAADIPTDAETINTMIRGEVQDLGEQNAESVVSAYQEGQDPVSYATQFKRAMQFGEEGRNLDIIKKSDSLSALTDYQKTKAYTMGRGMRVARAEEAAKNRKGLVKVGNVDSREIRGMKLDEAQSKGVDSISRLAKAVGFNVKFVARTFDAEGKANSRVNGSWDKATRTITIDINAGRLTRESANYALMQTAGHELTHFIKAFADTEMFAAYQDFVFGHLSEKMTEAELDDKVADYIKRWSAQGKAISRDQAIEEIVADASGDALLKLTEADIQQMAEQNPSLLKKIGEFIQKWVKDVKALIEGAYSGQKVRTAIADQMVDAVDELGAKWSELLKNAAMHARAVKGESIPVDAQGEVQFSLQENERLMQNATVMNDGKGNVPAGVLEKAAAARDKVAAFMRDDSRTLNLPEDIMGNTFFSDAAYGGTEENTTVCPRSIGADAFLDAVSDKIGRPLTVAEQVRISQDVIGAADIKEPQCIYCYVAADRAAYREFLGKYIDQRDGVIEALKNGETDTKALYETFLAGRKDTPNMKKRFNLWVESYQQGKRLLSAGDLANIGVLTAIQSDKYKQLSGDPNFAAQMKDALAYAQSASWAKKRVNYVAYNGHILKWGQNRINKLNSMYGLRMYSFSDFSPAFALENMQMVTDASVRGLKMLAYTKVPAFAEIFADTGMNINVSVFATEVQGDNGSSIVENNLMGADWKAAQKLRSEHENVGITFVATSDAQVEWALAQDWIDVCIPYHLVRTGRTIAEIMKYKNFTAESGDTKKAGWSKAAGNLSSIPAALHNNDRDTYMRLLEENNLEPRFARFVDNPNYMKLVNETRQSVTTSKPVQPIFNTDAAINALQDMANNGGYYVPIGGSEQRMYELADEFAGKVQAGEYQTDLAEDGIRYSIEEGIEFVEDKYYSRLIDRFEEQKPYGYLRVGKVQKDSILNKVGLPEANLYFDNTKIAKALSDHSDHLSKDILKGVPEMLRNPVVITEDKEPGNINVFANVWVGKSPVLVGIVVTQDGSGRNVINKVRTVHARRNAAEKISDESVLYLDINKKRTRDWFQTLGTHLPLSGTKFGFIRSIAQDTENVNLQLQDPSQITDREILATLAEAAVRSDDDRKQLNKYRNKIADLNADEAALEKARADLKQKRKEGEKKNRDDIIKLQNNIHTLENRMNRYEGELLKMEAMEPLHSLVIRERKEARRRVSERAMARAEERRKKEAEYRKTKLKELRDRKNESFGRQKYLKQVNEATAKLRTMVTTPTNKEHVPQFLRKPLGEFLDALDFTSKRQLEGGDPTNADVRLADAAAALRNAIGKISKQQSGLDISGEEFFNGYLDLPSNYIEEFDLLMTKVRAAIKQASGLDDTPINKMKSSDLHDLAVCLRTLQISINKMNRLLSNAQFAHADDASRTTISELDKFKAKKEQSKLMQKAMDFFDWKNTVPYYAFKRFGKGGQAIFESLQNGWDKLAFHADELVKFTDKAYKVEEVREWDKQIKQVKLTSGETVSLTTSQLMSLYCLAKREQALGHMMGGGIRIATIDGKRGKSVVQGENYILSEADIDTFRKQLTDRQREVADTLQQDMVKRGAEWGNEISMKRFGYEMFTEENYFPVESDRNNMSAKDPGAQENSLLRLLNMSATKDLTRGANNAIVVRSIFDVYTAHMSDMAKYNALALPILDAMKWLNYVERTQDDNGKITTSSVQKSLELTYGEEARRYIMEFIRNLNGETEGGRDEIGIGKLTSNYKIAAVGANLRVGLLQITSLPRAMTVINPKFLLSGIAKWNTRKGMSKTAMNKVGIAKWKSMGFYDTNISRNMRQMIKHDESAIDKTRGWSMKFAEWGDAWTMGVLYGAVESELVQHMAAGTKEFDEAMNKRMREIIYRTQVVDSTMTRSHLMRQKHVSGLMSFMSEPTLAMNMLNDTLFDLRMNSRSTDGTKWNPAASKTLAKVVGVSVLTTAAASVIEALFTAYRDDDEYEEFGEKFKEALWGDFTDAEKFTDYWKAFWEGSVGSNINPFSGVPIISTMVDALKSGADKQMWQEFLDDLGSGFPALIRAIRNDGSLADIYGASYKILNGFSKLVGVPMSAAVRELVAFYNTIVAEPMGWRRLQAYDNTTSEAAASVLSALTEGDTEKATGIRERAALYGIEEKDLNESLATRVNTAYLKGKVDRDTAESLLTEQAGKRSRQADKALTKSDYQLKTGLKHSEMKDDFISGTITEQKAREYLKTYDGLRKDEIDAKIGEWEYEKETGLSYGSMKEDFIDGVLTESQVKNYRMEYGDADEDTVQETLGHWKYERDTGLAYSEMKLDYADGIITESQARSYLAKYGMKDEEEVEEKISNFDYYVATGRTTSAPKYWRIAYAFDSGANYQSYIDEAFDQIQFGGEKRKSWKQARSQIASSLASYYKAQYLAAIGTAAGDAMLERILDLYEAIGYPRSYQREYIAENWIEDD